MTASWALELDRVRLGYGARVVVPDLSLAVAPGTICGLLGHNGSGKSTTLAAIAGNLTPQAGTIRVAGYTRAQHPAHYARRLGVVPQELAIYDELSVSRNLYFFGGLYGLGGSELRLAVRSALELVHLTTVADQRVRNLSGGMQRRVNLACALLHDPQVLLLDEPTVALDVEARAEVLEHLGRFRARGRAVVLTTHHLEDAARWCDRVAILEHGRLVREGPVAQLVPAPRLEAQLEGPFCLADWVDQWGTQVIAEVQGERLHLQARDQQSLGRALAQLLQAGVALTGFRTGMGTVWK
jgi:ABC-2 type transport system ATP-binding protein